jgi:nucleotide-binding universal stress UspA family protein
MVAAMDPDSVPNRKLLVALDGSRHSRNTLHYLALLFADRPEVHFHLFSLVNGVALPPGGEWIGEAERLNMISPQARKKLVAHKGYLRQGEEFLQKQGVAADRITSSTRLGSGSSAGDIVHEARTGMYDAIAVGRRGMTKIEEMLLGSVSNGIFDQCHDVPLWVIDGHIDSRRFLVPVDLTPYSLLAVDHLAFFLHDHPTAEITLFNSTSILAARPHAKLEDFHQHWDPAWCEAHLRREDSHLHAPRQILLESGFPAERIAVMETSKGFEPSRQIIRQALVDGYGTIVMGRRGPEARKGIFRGVSDRVLLMAEQVAVWVIG